MPPRIKLTSADGVYLVPWGRQMHRKLEKQRASRNRHRLQRSYQVDKTTVMVVASRFGGLVRIGSGGVAGFLCHPRSGPIVIRQFGTENHRMVDGGGWTPEGVALAANYAYPLVDDDHGTRGVSRTDGTWEHEADPPENYGNIDWKGVNTAAEGEPSDAPVLTWRGPASRYGSVPADLNTPGYSFLEEVVNPDGLNPLIVFTVFSPHVYAGGEILATAPPSWPDGGQWQNALVQGAAYFNDKLVIVANVNYRNDASGHAKGFFHTLFVEQDGEWVRAWEANLGRAKVCWFFSASGSKAICVLGGTIHRLVLTGENGTVSASYSSAAAGGTVFDLDTNHAQEQHTNVPPDLPYIGWPIAGHESEVAPYIGRKNGQSSRDTAAGSYRGTVILAIDYKGEVEAPCPFTASGSESSLKDKSADTVYGLADYLTDVDLADLDPDTFVPAMNVIDDGTGLLFSSNVCNPAYTASCGEMTVQPSGEIYLVYEDCFGDPPCEAAEQTAEVNLMADGGYYKAQVSREVTRTVEDPPPLEIDGEEAIASQDSTSTYTASGGRAPYTFSISRVGTGGCSLGSINAETGVYSTGSSAGGTMRVTVTDACFNTGYMDVKLPGGQWELLSETTYPVLDWAAWGYSALCASSGSSYCEVDTGTVLTGYDVGYIENVEPFSSAASGPSPGCATFSGGGTNTATKTCGGVVRDRKTYRVQTWRWVCS